MQSQISRESQSASFQTGSDSAREGSGAAEMQSGLIRGDYRYLNQIGSRSRGASDSSASDAQVRQERLMELHSRARSQQNGRSTTRMSEKKIHKHIEEGWKGERFQAAGVYRDQFKEDHVTHCLEKGWNATDFRFLQFTYKDFTEDHITRCIQNGWRGWWFLGLGFSSADFSEINIYYCLITGWEKKDFADLSIGDNQFTEGIITTLLKNGWNGQNFEQAGIPGTNFTENHIHICIQKGWKSADFKFLGFTYRDFKEDNIVPCIQKGWRGWDFLDLGFSHENFSRTVICDCLIAGWEKEDFLDLNIPGDRFAEEHITACIQKGWKAKDFLPLQISGALFSPTNITACLQNDWKASDFVEAKIPGSIVFSKNIDLCLQNDWKVSDFVEAKIPGALFSPTNITACLQKGWKASDFAEAEVPGLRFVSKNIALCIQNDWKASDFVEAKIPGDLFSPTNITACLQKGWKVSDFVKAEVPGSQFFSDNIALCIQNGWKAKDFRALGIFNDCFTADHITACVKNGWRGWELRGFGITEERLQQTDLTDTDYTENGWTDWDLNYFRIPDEEMSKKIFFLSYLYPSKTFQERYSGQQSAKKYNEGYQELYQPRKETTSRIDWNIPEVEEQEDLEAARESIRDLKQRLDEKFKEIPVTTSSNLLYNYTMHVDPNEATLLYCIKHIVDRIVKNYLSNDNASDIISNLIKLCNSVRTYIDAKDRDEKKNKKADIIQACEAFLLLLVDENGESELFDLISFVKDLEKWFDGDATLTLNPSGEIDDYDEINPENREQHNALFQKNIFNQHETMKKTVNWDNELGKSWTSYTYHSKTYNPWLQTFPEKKGVRYNRLRNTGLYQMSCMCSKIDKNIKLYRYIEYHRDPLLQICGYREESPLKKKKKAKDLWLTSQEQEVLDREEAWLKKDTITRLEEAKKEGIQLEDPAFMSTGFVPVPSYAREVMIVICCPAGTPMYITNFANPYKEVVLPRHTKLKILEVEDVGGTSQYGRPCQIVLTVEVTGVGM